MKDKRKKLPKEIREQVVEQGKPLALARIPLVLSWGRGSAATSSSTAQRCASPPAPAATPGQPRTTGEGDAGARLSLTDPSESLALSPKPPTDAQLVRDILPYLWDFSVAPLVQRKGAGRRLLPSGYADPDGQALGGALCHSTRGAQPQSCGLSAPVPQPGFTLGLLLSS